MPNIFPIQDDFSSGEITPKMQGHVRSREYQTGLAVCENFEVTPQSSIRKRLGTRYYHTFDEEDTQVILKTFRRELGKDVVIAITENDITLWSDEGRIESGKGNLIFDPLFFNGINSSGLAIEKWKLFSINTGVEQGGTAIPLAGEGVKVVGGKDGDINSDPFPRTLIAQFFNIEGGQDYRLTVDMEFVQGIAGRVYTGTLTIFVVTFTEEDGGGSNTTLYTRIEGSSDESEMPPIGTRYLTDELLTFPSDVKSVSIQFQANPFKVGQGSPASTVAGLFTNISLTDPNDVPVPINYPTPDDWKTNLDRIQVAQDSAIGRMYFTVFGGTMHLLSYDKPNDAFDFNPFEPDVPDGSNLWVGDQPYTCAIFQGRLWLGGTPKDPSTLWCSRVWAYEDFDIPTTNITDDDPAEFTLAVDGRITWLEGLKTLLIGTDRGEVIGRAQNGVITSTDFSFNLEQTWGSTFIQPAEVANQALYVTADFKRLRGLYDGGDRANGYESEDLSLKAEQIAQKSLLELQWRQNPDYQLSMLLRDNSIGQATLYMPTKTNAWSKDTTQGQYLSITSTEGQSGSVLWQAVERNGRIILERRFNEADLVYLDSVIRKPYTGTVFDGLEHLNGLTCSVVALNSDNTEITILPDAVPVNGEIELPNYLSGLTIAVGLSYTAKLQTLPFEGSNQAGTAQVQRRRFSEVFLRLVNSGIPKIEGERPPIRTPDNLLNESQELFTGDTALHQAGYNNGIINIEQDLPLPTLITAIFGKAKGSNV